MALTDNLVIKVKAESGQSVITDSISSATFSGAGTATLVNDGTYGNLWRIAGGALSATLSGMGNWTDTTAKTTTLAARFRVSNRGSNYNRFIQVGNDASNGMFFGNAGTATGNLREGIAIAGSSVGTPSALSYTTGDVVTLVMTFNETTTTSDPIKSWKGTTGRSGTAADATGTCSVSSSARAIASAVLSVTTETLDLLNLAVWNRGLTDAEAASVADDIGQLWVGDASFDILATTVLPSFSGSAQVSPVTSFAVTAGLPVFSGSASVGAASFSFTTTTSSPAFSGSATGDTSSATITITDLRDLTTGNLRTNETGITVIVNNITTGALVVLLTGQASTAGGDMVLTHASFVAGTQYRVTIILSDGSEGTWKYTAA